MRILKIKLITQPQSEEAKKAVGYHYNKIAGTRHYLGGTPERIEEGDYPVCDECENKMTFYAQIDSIGDEFDLADCMVIHNYVCFDCFTVKAELAQTTA